MCHVHLCALRTNEPLRSQMAPHQQVLLVPGTFGCTNLSATGRKAGLQTAQAGNVVAKLEGLFSWAKTEPRVGGFLPWHWANRMGMAGAGGAPCDQALGAEAMPAVVAKLAEIGGWIVNRTNRLSLAANRALVKTDDTTVHRPSQVRFKSDNE